MAFDRADYRARSGHRAESTGSRCLLRELSAGSGWALVSSAPLTLSSVSPHIHSLRKLGMQVLADSNIPLGVSKWAPNTLHNL